MQKEKLPIPRVLTNSLRSQWTTCHRRFYYRVIEGLEPIVKRRPLWLGSLWHAGLAAFYRGMKADANKDLPVPHQAIDAAFQAYADGLEDLPDDEAVALALEGAQEVQATAHLLLDRYLHHWQDFHDSGQWEVLHVEEPFEIRLLTSTGNPSHWKYTGIPDLVARDLSDKRIKIVDHKTTSRTNREAYTSELELDPQSRGYCLLWWELQRLQLPEAKPEVDFIFNVQRSAMPSEPMTLVCRKCNAKVKKDPAFTNPDCLACKGTNVSGLSKAKDLDTTEEKYRAALAQYPHLNPAEYEEVFNLLQARADSWMYRVELNYEEGELVDFHREAYELTREISEANYWTRNFAACWAPGRVCIFRNLCLAEGNDQRQEEARQAFRVVDPGAPDLRDSGNGKDVTMAAISTTPF